MIHQGKIHFSGACFNPFNFEEISFSDSPTIPDTLPLDSGYDYGIMTMLL
jgi:hypothetical protein